MMNKNYSIISEEEMAYNIYINARKCFERTYSQIKEHLICTLQKYFYYTTNFKNKGLNDKALFPFVFTVDIEMLENVFETYDIKLYDIQEKGKGKPFKKIIDDIQYIEKYFCVFETGYYLCYDIKSSKCHLFLSLERSNI